MLNALRGVLLCLAATAIVSAADDSRIGVPYDWSHHHQVFSQADTYQRLSELQTDPRYWHNLYRRTFSLNAADNESFQDFLQNLFDELFGGVSVDGSGAKVDWGESVSTTALTYTAAENFPAKYSFNSASPVPDCTNDYVVFTLPATAATKANLVAFNNLYVNNTSTGKCPGTTPNAVFTYFASQNAGALSSSPALSLDGKQIAFIENASSAQFHVVKWHAGDKAATFGSPFNAAKMVNCQTNGAVAPCEYSVIYGTGTAALSAPFIDYATDTAYVTNDAGKVISISPVFGGGQPVVKSTVTVAGSTNMTAPVYDSVSKNVFVADKLGKLYYIRTAVASLGTCAAGVPPCLGTPSLTVSTKAVTETPMIDTSSGTVFAFSNSSPSGANSSVVQTNTKLSTSVVATVGPLGTQNVRSGQFNNNYYNSPATGLLYVCGTNATNIPQLFAIKFTGSTMNAGAAARGPLALATALTSCSALTEVFNTSQNKDELYMSVANKCTASITGGCVRRFDITSAFPAAATNTVAETGGTTAIIIDNVSNGVSGNDSQSNLYFVSLSAQSCTKYTGGTVATGNCAVKLTQSALQ